MSEHVDKVWLGAAKPASKGHGKDFYLDSLDEAKLQEVATARGVKLKKDDDKAKTKAELQAELHASQTAWLQRKDYADAQLDAMHAAGDGGQAQVAAIAAARTITTVGKKPDEVLALVKEKLAATRVTSKAVSKQAVAAKPVPDFMQSQKFKKKQLEAALMDVEIAREVMTQQMQRKIYEATQRRKQEQTDAEAAERKDKSMDLLDREIRDLKEQLEHSYRALDEVRCEARKVLREGDHVRVCKEKKFLEEQCREYGLEVPRHGGPGSGIKLLGLEGMVEQVTHLADGKIKVKISDGVRRYMSDEFPITVITYAGDFAPADLTATGRKNLVKSTMSAGGTAGGEELMNALNPPPRPAAASKNAALPPALRGQLGEPDPVYCSPSRSAVNAALTAFPNSRIILDERLREFPTGSGLTAKELMTWCSKYHYGKRIEIVSEDTSTVLGSPDLRLGTDKGPVDVKEVEEEEDSDHEYPEAERKFRKARRCGKWWDKAETRDQAVERVHDFVLNMIQPEGFQAIVSHRETLKLLVKWPVHPLPKCWGAQQRWPEAFKPYWARLADAGSFIVPVGQRVESQVALFAPLDG